MCGRFTLFSSKQKIAATFHLQNQPTTQARYNIAPTQDVLGLIHNSEQQTDLTSFRWGLIPSWSKDAGIGAKMINARAETLSEKPSFKSLLSRRRCAIVADGFYEWKQEGKGKVPMYITLKSEDPFAFAGLWDSWKSPTGEVIESCTVITTSANTLVSSVHQRMPVMLTPESCDDWLSFSGQDTPALLSLLQPFPAEEMQMRQVSRLVNNARVDSPELLESLGPAQNSFPDLFGF